MKQILLLYIGLSFLFTQQIKAQVKPEKITNQDPNNPTIIEVGFNVSLPVHIEMYRSHRLAIGANLRIAEKITSTTEFGFRVEYDYRFTKKNHPEVPPDSTIKERALYRNFSLFSIKPNIQFNLNSNWSLGAESGIGYARSDEDPNIGLGFVSEFNGPTPFGWCSGIYVGKYLVKNKLNISLCLTNFVAHGHAENTLGLKFNYCFNKKGS
ncbi:hypothetical protein [Flavobacterium sp. K5-23]|uniref:hypothetical protein n=1 Tax=Flavobacterium sp. K5-23 TaxID=2746225 RepID=UPI00200E2E6A|nr:hypothetical protein [Flavobacterium sp. K5-23]UQD57320.1 hypothetical protein FLAK523_13325 [Flavobacterium sp. K5-23]